MKGWPYGSAINKDGTIKYFSPSALMTADPSTSEGCMRKYYYQYIKKIKQEEQDYQVLGKDLHAQNEHYLLTGEKSMGPLAMGGFPMLPRPFTVDPRILIEHEIGGGDLLTAPIRAAGVPMVGYIDCIHWQGINPGTNDVTETIDPPNTVEVIDWKTTSSDKWIKSAQEVSRTLQMTTYGKWAVDVKNAEHVRLSHGYYITKGRHTPRKVSLRVHKDQINERWEYVEKLAGSLNEIVKEDNADRVPANTRACDAYRGCPHQKYCSAYAHNSLASVLGSEMASSLLGLDSPANSIITVPEDSKMTSLLSKLQTPTAPVVAPDVQAEMSRLALEEANLKYPGLVAVIDELETVGLGFPTLTGEAARVFTLLKGSEPKGSGELVTFAFEDPALLSQVLVESKNIVKQRADEALTAVVSVFPDDAPPSLASPPVKAEPEPIVTVTDALAVAAGTKKRGPKPKKTKTEEPAPAMTLADIPMTTLEVSQTEEPTPEAIAEKVEQIKAQEPKPDSSDYRATVVAGPVNLYVDCIPSCGYESLWTLINGLTSAMAKKYGGDDYRTCKDTDYGKWKGVLAAGLRLAYDKGHLPPGNYLLDNTMNETASVVIETMREIVGQSGGLLVRGIR